MDKPTIFFSHSSKDKDLILPIKNKIVDITGGVMEIFMSSDGQSIPLGRNWVSKIEDGLKKAQIMFIFITPNSIKSDWIYFEAGYAYAKGIEVIPVGIGVHIGELSAPLNLLQGFDILSCDSLDNFISILNKKFDLSFRGNFDEAEYSIIRSAIFDEEIIFSKVFKFGLYSFCLNDIISYKKNIIKYCNDGFFHAIKTYLDKNKIQYSFSNYVLLVQGIKIVGNGNAFIEESDFIKKKDKIMFYISTYNLKKSLDLLVKILDALRIDSLELKLKVSDEYEYLFREEEISAILSLIDVLDYSDIGINIFKYKEKINWWITDMSDDIFSNGKNQGLEISFKQNDANISDVIDLINCLYEVGIIYKKKNNT